MKLKQLSIFVVDDEQIIGTTLPLILQNSGYLAKDTCRCEAGVAWRHDYERPCVFRVDGIPIR